MNKDKALMATAKVFARESYCKRNKVGAVLAMDGRILSTGYNGALSGLENICEDGEVTMDSIVHAEQNVISFAAREGISTKGTTLYVTVSPCVNCAKLIVQAGISKVIYHTEYRCTKGVDLLRSADIIVNQYKGK